MRRSSPSTTGTMPSTTGSLSFTTSAQICGTSPAFTLFQSFRKILRTSYKKTRTPQPCLRDHGTRSQNQRHRLRRPRLTRSRSMNSGRMNRHGSKKSTRRSRGAYRHSMRRPNGTSSKWSCSARETSRSNNDCKLSSNDLRTSNSCAISSHNRLKDEWRNWNRRTSTRERNTSATN